MTDISTPAEDLAALDRVKDLAARYGVAFAGTDVRLRGCIEQEGDRLHALGATLADLIPILFGNDEDAIGSLVVRAIASVGAEIVWPSPDSGEVADRSAGDDTAPTTGCAMPPPPIGRVPGWYRAMDAAWATRFYGFPAEPTAGQEWASPEGSGWTYELTGQTGCWELRQYASVEYPGDDWRIYALTDITEGPSE